MIPMVAGEPIWVITALTQSADGGTGSVTIGSTVLAVAPSRRAAEDILDAYQPWIDGDVIDIRIEEASLVSC